MDEISRKQSEDTLKIKIDAAKADLVILNSEIKNLNKVMNAEGYQETSEDVAYANLLSQQKSIQEMNAANFRLELARARSKEESIRDHGIV